MGNMIFALSANGLRIHLIQMPNRDDKNLHNTLTQHELDINKRV